MEIKFDGAKIAVDITWDDLAALESGSIAKSLELLSRFVVQDGATLTPKEGKKILGKIPASQVGAVIAEFWKTMREGAVNPTSGGN